MAEDGRAGLPDRARTLPERPGVYLFKDAGGAILYIGKARSLRDRVRSYFSHGDLAPKISRMVAEAADLEVILTNSEVEALILENNLVKREQPRYNTMLRDDKNFPYLKMTIQDSFPRVVVVRKAQLDGSLYFGPYLPASYAHRALKMVARFFQVAICHERLDGTRPRPCLYYQLDQCMGPCAGLAEKDMYGRAVQDARLFLEGKSHELVESLKGKMSLAAERQEYENAAHYRDLIRMVASFSQRQNIASVGLEEQDYFHMHREGERAALQVFSMRRGLVQSRREFTFDAAQEDDARFLSSLIQLYYAEGSDLPERIYVPCEPADQELLEQWLAQQAGRVVSIRVPRRGVKAVFLDLVRKNAKLAFESRFRSPHTFGVEILDALQEALGLPETPYRIECFDISHIQGADTVASMVVWEGGRARRSDYRKFKVKTVAGVDDFASMREVVGRRYARLLKEGKNLPDLILIDGGKGQLSSAVEALSALGVASVPIAALAKKEELLFVPGRAEPIALDHHSPILHLVQRVRDEAHRFAVAYHRSLRRKRTIASSLSEIPGVGETSARKLLKRFGSLEGIRSAGAEQINEVVGRRIAQAVMRHLRADPAAPREGEGGADGGH
ncbi:MAG TPA: excinuclease ABC subunit UvrC [Candidatus Polarisedimenticolia bacterium]|nr:excinuclease ABC subunit UvrC [Candidatus Polarisedimenticolia bacterium]